MQSVRILPDGQLDEAAAALVRAAASSAIDDHGERRMIVERGIAAGVWHVGPAALPIPLLSL